jgi:hypothetical protein
MLFSSIAQAGSPSNLTFIKAFGASSIVVNGSTSLTFTLSLDNLGGGGTGAIGFTDTLPAGLVVSTPSGLSAATCPVGGGAITAVAGSGTVSLAGANMPNNGSCTFSLNVTGTTAGVKNNSVTTTPAYIQPVGGSTKTATATLSVLSSQTPPTPPVPAIALTGMQPVSESGTSATITITLNNGSPTANVVIPIVSTNTSEVVVSVPAITFTPGGPTSQTFAVTGVDDQVVDGDQSVLIQVGPAQSTDRNYANYKPTDFNIVNRDNDWALPALPFADGGLTGFVDITNTGSSAISSVLAKFYDVLGDLRGSGTLVQSLPGKGNVSIDMQALQAALGVIGTEPKGYARIELFPVGGEIIAQARVRNGSDTYNASIAARGVTPGMQSSAASDGVVLRITNLSGQRQEGRATLYGGDGSVLGLPNTLLFLGLPPKASIAFNAANLQSTVGVAPWTNRAWLRMSDPDSFVAQVLNASAGVRTLTAMKNIGVTQSLNYILPAGDVNVVSMIRIYNNEAYPTQFDAVLYGPNGAQLAAVPLGTVPAHGVLMVSNSQLRAMPGVPAWTGAARMKIISDSTSFQAQGSLRNMGFLVDTTSVITDGIVAHLPDATEGLDIELNIVNPGAQSTTLTGTLTNNAGQVIGTANFAIGSLAATASTTLTRANLVALAGTWTGRATLTIASTLGNVEVLALLRNTTTSALTNLSERPMR